MPRFKKKPVEIEARHFSTDNDDGSCINGLAQWMSENGADVRGDGTSLFIETLEGTHRADCGDWIIRGIKGEFYPCKPDIFDATYDRVAESA